MSNQKFLFPHQKVSFILPGKHFVIWYLFSPKQFRIIRTLYVKKTRVLNSHSFRLGSISTVIERKFLNCAFDVSLINLFTTGTPFTVSTDRSIVFGRRINKFLDFVANLTAKVHFWNGCSLAFRSERFLVYIHRSTVSRHFTNDQDSHGLQPFSKFLSILMWLPMYYLGTI